MQKAKIRMFNRFLERKAKNNKKIREIKIVHKRVNKRGNKNNKMKFKKAKSLR